MTNNQKKPSPPVPVVGIGASAGGLREIKTLLEGMPPDTGAAFVIVQHLDPAYESKLGELLASSCDLAVVTIRPGMRAQANRVHVLPSGHHLGINADGTFILVASQAREAVPTLIDRFFRELAAARGRRAVGIILSGNGSDGTLGLKAIRSYGGLAMAQDPDQAEFDAMPRAAAKHASPDCLLETANLVTPLCSHLRLTLAGNEVSWEDENEDKDKDKDKDIDDQTLETILQVLREQERYDFRYHKPSMLKRRLKRRMALDGVADTETYLHILERQDAERQRLCSDFLISVTDFFREPESYRQLEQQVIGTLLHHRSVDDPIRVWVPACATGEEAYSIAMLLSEAIEASGRDHRFVLFASDIDEAALARARVGLYPDSIAHDLSAERLRTFFDKVDGHYQIKSRLRERVVFAAQSITNDPPYSRLDLISCRNLLIYLTADTQRRLITLFHFALKDGGFLALGSSETIGTLVDLFEPLSKECRLYRRLAANRQYRVAFPAAHPPRGEPAPRHNRSYQGEATEPREAEKVARDILLKDHVPASVLINRRLEILCSYGATADFLSLPQGQSSLELLNMVHDEYRSHLRAVTHRAFRQGERSKITTKLQDSREQTLVITARPLQNPASARGLVLITFERERDPALTHLQGLTSSDLEQQLAEELDATRNELYGTIAALEESNEDLKGSNEEIMSMNEELQSTNEELETSKEELQSVNEELTTVNAELESKVDELEGAHDDLNNLFAGTQVATLFLDRRMCIKRFTPAIQGLLSLLSTDIGRPLRDMTLKFHDPDLLHDAERVLAELTPSEREVRANDQRWYQRRIVPYRTRGDVINGVVVTFADISELKSAVVRAQDHEARLDLAIGALSGGMWEMTIDPTAPEAGPEAVYLSPRLKQLLGYADADLPSTLQAWTERILPVDRDAFDAHMRHWDGISEPIHYRIRHRDGGLRWFASYGMLLPDWRGDLTRWIGIDADITEQKKSEADAWQAQSRVQLLIDVLPERVAFIDHQNVLRFVNSAFCHQFGGTPDKLTGRHLAEVVGESLFADLHAGINRAQAGKTVRYELASPHTEYDEGGFQVSLAPHLSDDQVLGYFLILARNTATADGPDPNRERKLARRAYLQRMATMGEMASTLAHDLNQPLSAVNSYAGALVRLLHADKPAAETVPLVHKMSAQVERAGGIVADVRRFLGQQHSSQESVDLGQVVDLALSLTAGRARKRNIETEFSQSSPLPMVQGDAVQLQQVVINLIINAVDAMAGSDGERRLWLHSEADGAEHVQVTVGDSGPGIPAGKLEAIFDPFESSKLDGMGMGLAISRSIAQWHGGQLWAESQYGHGAQFYLRLPIARHETDP